MLGGKIPFSLASIAFASAALAAASCASILGIEEIHPDSDGGSTSVGDGGVVDQRIGGRFGVGGASSTGGSAGAGTGGGSGAVSGSSGGSTVATGSGGAAGSAPDASATGGASGARDGGVSEGGPPITVHGTVIDYWRHRVPNIDVFLGTATTKTDANGQFTFNNVSPPYDIGLALRLGQLQFGGAEDAWLFRGLKRADPTLQVKEGSVGGSSSGTTWKFQNFPARGGTSAPYRFTGLSFASPDTNWSETFTDVDGTDLGASSFDLDVAMSAGTARALLWETNGPTNLAMVSPARFLAFDPKALTVDAVTAKVVTFDMTADSTPAQMVSGTITSRAAGLVQLDGYVRFDDGGPIHVVQVSGAPATFQMLMPQIAGSTITVAAVAGSTPAGPFALAHLDGLTPGQAGVALTVPAPVSHVSPAAAATNVASTAMFQWSASPSVAFLYIYCPGVNTNEGPTRFFVVTEDSKTQLPVFASGGAIPWPKNRDCNWSVEVHGSYATVDAATGTSGFFDPFTLRYYGALEGPKRDNGSFTESGDWGFKTAP